MPEKIPALLLLAGDSYLAGKKFTAHFAQIQAAIQGQVSSQTVYLSQTPLETVLTASRNLSFLTRAQVFRVKEISQIKEKQLEMLAAYLARPAESAFFVFEAETLAKDSPLMKLLAKHGQIQIFEDSEKKSAGGRLIREKLRNAGKSLDAEALQRLEEEAGEAPALLDSLLEQLILRAGDQKEISFEMFEAFRENWKEVDVFSLTEAVAAKNAGRALTLLRRLLDAADQEPFALVGILHWQIRRLWLARILLDEGQPERNVLQKCKVFSAGKQGGFLRQVRSFSRPQIEKTLEGLFKFDWKLKTGQVEGEAALESWVVEAAS
ncbi:MAG TPA: DNA polymerase III subunit delta [bacterium]|nr:DNA polymerase III subunit delta [bacterium]